MEFTTVLEAARWFHGAGRACGMNARINSVVLRAQLRRPYRDHIPDSLDAPDLIPAGGHEAKAGDVLFPGFGGLYVRRGE